MTDIYLTIEAPATGIYKEKGSKFLAFALPVNSADEVKTALERYRKEFFDARHVCYAYRLGADKTEFRANDDGEPSGTAGKPILGQILSGGLTDMLIVVVRYFGGILLGTGGLITAYRAAAADAIMNARTVERTVEDHFVLHFPYEATNSVMRVVKEENISIEKQEFETLCRLQIRVRRSLGEKVESRFSKVENVCVEKINWQPVPINH